MLHRLTITTTALLLLSLTSAMPTTASPSTTYTPPYANRIIFIRHAEKGFATDPNPDDGPPPGGFPGHKRGWLPSWLGGGAGDGDHPPPGPPPGNHTDGPPGPPPGRGGKGGPPGRGGPPGGGPPGKMPNGLSVEGKDRAQYLRTYFTSPSYDIGLIFAAPRVPADKAGERTYATVAPLAGDLELEIEIDCANAPATCIVSKIEEFAKTSDKDILISWKHFDLNGIATALGAPNAKKTYPDRRNDIVWIMYDGRIQEKRSQHCPILDDARVDENDTDLVVEGDDDVVEDERWYGPGGHTQEVWNVEGAKGQVVL